MTDLTLSPDDFAAAKQYARLARIAGSETLVRRALTQCAAARLFLMAMPARQLAAWVGWARTCSVARCDQTLTRTVLKGLVDS